MSGGKRLENSIDQEDPAQAESGGELAEIAKVGGHTHLTGGRNQMVGS
jgi:hypothetical protein